MNRNPYTDCIRQGHSAALLGPGKNKTTPQWCLDIRHSVQTTEMTRRSPSVATVSDCAFCAHYSSYGASFFQLYE